MGRNHFVLLLIFSWIFYGCSEDEVRAEDVLTVPETVVNFSQNAEKKVIAVKSNMDWKVTVSSQRHCYCLRK